MLRYIIATILAIALIILNIDLVEHSFAWIGIIVIDILAFILIKLILSK